MTSRRLALLVVPALAACGNPAPADPRLVQEWAQRAIAAAQSERLTAPVASRVSAYTAIALYEGYAADQRSGLRSLASQVNGLWSVPKPDGAVDGPTVAAHAAREVLDSLLAGSAGARRVTDSLADAQIAQRRSSGVGRDRSEHSIALGRGIARAILSWEADDGFRATRSRPWSAPRSGTQWVPPSARPQAPQAGSVILAGAPATPAVEPHWGSLRTFVLRNASECAPPRPPLYSEARGSDFWKMGRELADSLARATPEQRAAAAEWTSDALLSLATWHRAGQHVVRARRLSAASAAEAFALTAIAAADAYVAVWREKYRSLLVRPTTYMPRVFNVSRPPTDAPASPEYPAEQAVVAAAAASALVSLFGDTVAFVDSTAAPRTFAGFGAASDEMAAAALYAGLQFVPSVVHGREQGACIGQRVVGRIRTRP